MHWQFDGGGGSRSDSGGHDIKRCFDKQRAEQQGKHELSAIDKKVRIKEYTTILFVEVILPTLFHLVSNIYYGIGTFPRANRML